MKTTRQFTESRVAPLSVLLVVAAVFLAIQAHANTESGISTTSTNGLPSACLESDLRALIEDCIARNQTNPPPGNPGPFTRGYKEMVFLMGQCFSGGFHSLTNIGPNIIVGASADAQKVAHAGIRLLTAGTNIVGQKEIMVWFEVFNEVIRQNTNAQLKAILEFVRTNNPDGPAAMTPPPACSPGAETIVLGDAMKTRTNDSFHAVLFGGYSDIAGKEIGQTTAEQWRLRIASANALKDMRATLEFFLNVPGTNIDVRSAGTYAELGAMITNAWAKMNDNEQFILFVADHGSRHCGNTNPVPRPGGNGFSAGFVTEPYLKDPAVQQPFVGLTTSFVDAPGEVWFNGHCIGTLPVNGPAYREFTFKPNLIKPVGETNLVEVVVPHSNVGVPMVDLFTGPVLGNLFATGGEPCGAVINVCNATGSSKTGFQIVYEGRLNADVMTRARRTQADGTPIADWDVGGPTITYDAANGVTTVSWEDPGNPIPGGGYASFSVVTSNQVLKSLKYAWMPSSSNPTNDLVPVNLKTVKEVTSSNITLAILSAPFIAHTQELTLTVRYAPNRLSATDLYFNSSAITSLPVSSTQTVVLEPESARLVSFPLPPMSPLDPRPTAIVESWENWANVLPANDISRITEMPMLPTEDTTRLTQCPGSGVFFTVNVAGGDFQWYKDGNLIPGQTGDTLVLTNLNTNSAGIYTGIGTNTSEIKRKFSVLAIADDTTPTLTGPANITVKATSASGATVNYGSIGVSDSCGQLDGGTFQCSHPPGSLFPIGTTEVSCSIADTFGNVGRYNFYVTVLPQDKDLIIHPNNTYMVLWWADTNAILQSASQVTGPYTSMPEATSPYTVTPLKDEEYFRYQGIFIP